MSPGSGVVPPPPGSPVVIGASSQITLSKAVTSRAREFAAAGWNGLADWRFSTMFIAGVMLSGLVLEVLRGRFASSVNPKLLRISTVCGKIIPYLTFSCVLHLPSQIEEAKGAVTDLKNGIKVRSKKRVVLNGVILFDTVMGGLFTTAMELLMISSAFGLFPPRFHHFNRFIHSAIPVAMVTLGIFLGGSAPIFLARTVIAGPIQPQVKEEKGAGDSAVLIEQCRQVLKIKETPKPPQVTEEEKALRKLRKALTDGTDREERTSILSAKINPEEAVALLKGAHTKKVMAQVIGVAIALIFFISSVMAFTSKMFLPGRITNVETILQVTGATLLISSVLFYQLVKPKHFIPHKAQ